MWKHGVKYQLCRKLYSKGRLRLCRLLSLTAYQHLTNREMLKEANDEYCQVFQDKIRGGQK